MRDYTYLNGARFSPEKGSRGNAWSSGGSYPLSEPSGVRGNCKWCDYTFMLLKDF